MALSTMGPETGIGSAAVDSRAERGLQIKMPETSKVGIVYREDAPDAFRAVASSGLPWEFEFFQEHAILRSPVSPRRDFLAIFFLAEGVSRDNHRYLSNVFPGAEIVAYSTSEMSPGDAGTQRQNGFQILHSPISPDFIRHLLENLEQMRAGQRELSLIRKRTDELQEFFDAFVNVVESSWSAGDRRLGMSLLVNKILTHLHAEECIIYLVGGNSCALQRAYSTGNIKDIDIFDYQANGSILENVFNSGTYYANNNYSFEIKVPFGKESFSIRSVLCFPLQRRGEKIGVIEIINKQSGGFTEDDIRLVQMLVNPITVAIRNIGMFENAERLTITDDLTKLYNYRYLMQYLDGEVKRCLRYKKKVSLLFIDVDGFKRINDTFGHLVGSQALSEIGQVLRRMLRETDIVSRYGGDEFVIVLPETPLNGAMVIAERIRKKIEDYEFVAQNLTIHLTVSLGVANCPKHALTAEGLIKKADAAMYRAKELSRNSIKVAV
jgi:diguanylate cyclase (GGDEF)-like protein